jgi:hypothetical protein
LAIAARFHWAIQASLNRDALLGHGVQQVGDVIERQGLLTPSEMHMSEYKPGEQQPATVLQMSVGPAWPYQRHAST